MQLPNGRVDLVFTIDEGGKTGIRRSEFVGNQAVSDYRLRGLMQTTEMNFLSWIKTTDVYDPDRLASDEEAIRSYYMKNGYADFRITNTDVVYQADPPGYVITITMEEGRSTTCRPCRWCPSSRRWMGRRSLDSSICGPAISTTRRRRQVGRGDHPRSRAAGLRLFGSAPTRRARRRQPSRSRCRSRWTTVRKSTSSASTFVGNTRTRDYVIRREFDIGEGDPYNHVLIERAERRLNGLGYFKKVKISNRPGSAPDRVIIIVDVEDQPTGSFSLSGGYSTTEGFLAEARVYGNELPRPRPICAAAASPTGNKPGLEGSFTEPYFLGQRMAAGFDVFHQTNSNNPFALLRDLDDWPTLRLGVPITDDLTLPAQLFALQVEDHHPGHLFSALRRLRRAQPDVVSGRNRHRRSYLTRSSTV